ncbi:MAG: folate-binding protein, partial [Pseudomonadales bacterium]|nr:folate-binding protein [Pseudomonadales bacterium]
YLGKYIAFSKAKMTDVSDQFVHIGCWGAQIETLLGSEVDIPPLSINEVHSSTACLVIRVADSPERFSCLCSLEKGKTLWKNLATNCEKMPSQSWQLMNIRGGIPEISLSTTEQFIPQMLNLDLIGGISFKKGCYTGQEIIARSHYLGKQKRRLFRLQTNSTVAPLPGAGIFVEDKLQAIGTIINTAVSPTSNGHEILAVLKIGAHDKKLFLDEENEEKLSLIPLPYAIPFE